MQRQVDEFAAAPPGYEWDETQASHACEFAEALAYPKGPKRGQPFQIEAWQVWTIRCLFGWVDAVTRMPRFHLTTIFLPKGNGKTPLAAIIGLNVLARGQGIGAKVYCAATTQKQAREVFEAAQEMLRLSPELRDAAELVVGEHAIKGAGDNRAFEPISAEHKSAEGKVPDCVIIDEIHVHPNRRLYDNLRSAASKVEGSRVVVISTAGNDMTAEAVGYQVYGVARDILLGKVQAPAHFALIAEADEDADPWAEETWRQANPNLGVSVSLANFRTTVEEVRNQPSAQPDFMAKRLGRWQQSAGAFLDVTQWNALSDPDLRLEDLAPDGWAWTAGVDLARTRDLTAVVLVAGRQREDGKREYRVFSRWTYLAEHSITLTKIPELRAWAPEWLTLTPGDSTSYATVKADIADVCRPLPGVEVCFDDWCAAEMEEDLLGQGLMCVSVRQGAKTQSEPMKELEAAVLDRRLRHDGSPVMAMAIGNLIARTDRNGGIAPDRENEYKKIDPAVALINAMVRASVSTGTGYEGDGLTFV